MQVFCYFKETLLIKYAIYKKHFCIFAVESNNIKSVVIMDSLIKIYLRLLQETDEKIFRYLYPHIDWHERCVAIIGAKGVGKTTMLLQHINPDCSPSSHKSL